jgi:diguanylate cyclase (GGDEF)-like protein/PAS domain S-box-containing protein
VRSCKPKAISPDSATWQSMRIRSYIAVFLVACLLGSYVSVYVLVNQYSREQEASRQHTATKLALKDVEQLAGHLKQFLLSKDLILASGVTYLVAGAVENAGLVDSDLERMEQEQLYGPMTDEIQTLRASIGIIRQSVDRSKTLDPERDTLELSKLLERSDVAADDIIAALDELEMRLQMTAKTRFGIAQTQGMYSQLAAFVIILMFSLMVFVIWLWTARHISSPLRNLSRQAESALDYAGVFSGTTRGPLEVTQLSEKLHRLISGLEEEVTRRTRELTSSKTQLEVINDRLQEKIREHYLSEARFESSFRNAPIGMAIVRPDGDIVKFNRSFGEFFGGTERELLNASYVSLLHKKEQDKFEDHFSKLIAGLVSQIQLQHMYTSSNGDGIWGLLSVSLVTDEQGEPSYAIFQLQDITDSYQLSEKLTYQAQHDALTNLLNRYEFENRLSEFIADAKRNPGETGHVLCYLDLDQFKIVNDTCGHLAGDELLKNVADCLVLQLRESDVAARLGGDEFGLLLRNCPMEKAVQIANKLREKIQEIRYQHDDKVFRVGASLGMTVIDGRGFALKDLMSAADSACYMAKEAGRDRIHVVDLEDDVLEMHTREMMAVSNINYALEYDRFMLVRQPIVVLNENLAGASGKHYEILLRMLDKDGNSISPGAFLPAAERYQLASRIDRWVVEAALARLSECEPVPGERQRYAINLSGQTMSNRDLLADISAIVRNTRLVDTEVCFEITETAAISNLQNARAYIEELKSLGCSFALDDFGRGLSSFGYLKNLPVDYLKIDGEFVRDIVSDKVDRAMVRSINEVAHASNKLTVAEFVENEAIADVLRDIGVDYGQGYHFGKPEPWVSYETRCPALMYGN